MEGYMGIWLRIDLSSRAIRKEPLDPELIRGFVGGRGVNSKILFNELQPGVDPLGPENKIVIGTGPCNGTLVPGSSRFTVSSKSPLTGFLGDSNAGGSFGAGLKYAGYDGIVIEGKADSPVYLWIDDDKIELRSARHLMGKAPRETARAIQREHFDPEIDVISIGPAGEHLVRFGNLITDLGRALGRTGQGAVFGSKNLKAVAVRGSKGVKVADPKALRESVREMYDAWMGSAGKGGGLNLTLDLRARYGPAGGWTRYQKSGMFGTKNFQGGSWKRMVEELDDYYVKQKACFSCFAGCDHMFVIPGGPYAGAYGGGLELTTLDFGPNIGNEDMGLTAKLHERCDQYGMDYMDTRSAIGFAIECFERGILTEKDMDGLRLKWGDGETILGLVEKIAEKEGFGAVLAEGLKRASETVGKGSERYAIHSKGQALVGRDPRASKGWGLAYAVSTRGPCHVRAHLPEGYEDTGWDASVQKILRKYKEPTNPLSEEGKGELVKWHEDLQAVKNSMEICLFIIYPWTVLSSSVPEMLARLYRSVTGIEMDEDKLLTAGERIVNVEKAFNIREGWTRKDDTLPQRVLTEPYPDGPAKGQVVDLDPMVEEYYQCRGWDKETGLPKRDKLADLDLNDVVDELQNMGKLAS
jgi:aldehyde:ferredoxin oxidoreductase